MHNLLFVGWTFKHSEQPEYHGCGELHLTFLSKNKPYHLAGNTYIYYTSNFDLSSEHFMVQPTLQFFKEGSKKGEIVGADVAKLKNLMEQLYK